MLYLGNILQLLLKRILDAHFFVAVMCWNYSWCQNTSCGRHTEIDEPDKAVACSTNSRNAHTFELPSSNETFVQKPTHFLTHFRTLLL